MDISMPILDPLAPGPRTWCLWKTWCDSGPPQAPAWCLRPGPRRGRTAGRASCASATRVESARGRHGVQGIWKMADTSIYFKCMNMINQWNLESFSQKNQTNQVVLGFGTWICYQGKPPTSAGWEHSLPYSSGRLGEHNYPIFRCLRMGDEVIEPSIKRHVSQCCFDTWPHAGAASIFDPCRDPLGTRKRGARALSLGRDRSPQYIYIHIHTLHTHIGQRFDPHSSCIATQQEWVCHGMP